MQRHLMAEVERRAAKASARAKPVLLGILSTQAFVDALGGCCPEIVAMSAEQRLRWLDGEFAASEMVHNFGQSGGGGGPQSDVTVRAGSNASFFYNLWEIALLAAEMQPAPPPSPSPGPGGGQAMNCSEVNDNGMCGMGNCTAAANHRGYECVCKPGYRKSSNGAGAPKPEPWDSCDDKIPLNCTLQLSRPACENVTGLQSAGFQLPDCKWVTAKSRCVPLGEKSGSQGQQTTDVAEVETPILSSSSCRASRLSLTLGSVTIVGRAVRVPGVCQRFQHGLLRPRLVLLRGGDPAPDLHGDEQPEGRRGQPDVRARLR